MVVAMASDLVALTQVVGNLHLDILEVTMAAAEVLDTEVATMIKASSFSKVATNYSRV